MNLRKPSTKLFLTLLMLIFQYSTNAQSLIVDGIRETEVNSIPIEKFDLSGTWTSYTYSVVYDESEEKVIFFEPTDTVESVVFNRLIGFPSRAYRLMAVGGQNIWKNAVFNLDNGETTYKVYWLGADDVEWVANATTYGEIGVQFNIDVPDSIDGFDENLFIELVRN